LKGTTCDDVLDALFVGCTMTCVAVIVVLLVVPSTRAVLPLATALADAEFVPFSYVVDDVSLTVTFSPADVNSSKPDVDTLLTLPIDPPAAGPERALDPAPLEDAVYAAGVAPDELDVVADADVLPQPATPIAGAISAAAEIHPLLLPESNRRTLDRRVRLPMVSEADRPDGDAGGAGGAPAPAVVVAVILRLLRIVCVRVMVVHLFRCGSVVVTRERLSHFEHGRAAGWERHESSG